MKLAVFVILGSVRNTLTAIYGFQPTETLGWHLRTGTWCAQRNISTKSRHMRCTGLTHCGLSMGGSQNSNETIRSLLSALGLCCPQRALPTGHLQQRKGLTMHTQVTTLKFDEYGRHQVWEARVSWYGGKAGSSCLFATKEEAIKYAIFESYGADWAHFPSRGAYPYEDRNGLEPQHLSPVFRVSWDTEGGGKAEVYKTSICPEFDFGAPERMAFVNEVYDAICSGPYAFLCKTLGGFASVVDMRPNSLDILVFRNRARRRNNGD
jgi:hypothetical protein